MIDHLQGAGLRHTQGAGKLERGRYIRFQLVTDPFINAYWANSGYTAEELWGDHPPLRGTTAPLPGYDDDLVAQEE